MSSSALRQRYKGDSTTEILQNIGHSQHDTKDFVGSEVNEEKGQYSNPLILCFLIAFRIFDALVTRTYFNPDEYWQSVEPISLFYGAHPWHWYFTQGLPVILTSLISFIIYGVQSSMRKPHHWQHVKPLLQLICWVVTIYSLLGHKEFRFLYPLVPIFVLIAGYGFQEIYRVSDSSDSRSRATASRRYLRLSVLFFVLTNVPMAYYASVIHQSGVVEVMNYLRKEVDNGGVKDIGFLMP
ncbi:9103_t:CDS:2, partial [Acaulospora colombiana]